MERVNDIIRSEQDLIRLAQQDLAQPHDRP